MTTLRTPKQIKQKISQLKTTRSVWETHWQEITDHILPRKNTINNVKTDGTKRTFQLLDNTGMHSNELLAGALHGLLTNPDMYWFEFTTGDLQLDQNDNVRQYLQILVRIIHSTLNNSNFQTEVHELYIDLAALGTSAQYIEEDAKDFIRFATRFIAEYYVVENNLGFIDQLYREWKWTAEQIIGEFGEDKMHKDILKSFKDGKDEKFLIHEAVYPKKILGEGQDNQRMPYTCQYTLPDKDHELRDEDFESFPYVVPRWTKAAGESYGRSPGMNALPEIKVLNKMNETMLIGAQKQVDPPIQMPDDGFIMPIVTRPGGINYYRSGSQDFIKPVFNDTRLDFGYQAMEDRRHRVRDAYFVDQLKLRQAGPEMTATEVLQRTEESMRLLGPMLGRMQSEYLRPMIQRVYKILQRRGVLPPPPPELQGRGFDVKYSSLIAKSQRISEGQNIMRVAQAIAPFIQMDPTVADNFNGDNMVRIIGQVYGMPQEGIRNAKEVKAIRDNREQQRQALAQAQQEAQATQNTSVQADTMQKIQGMNGNNTGG